MPKGDIVAGISAGNSENIRFVVAFLCEELSFSVFAVFLSIADGGDSWIFKLSFFIFYYTYRRDFQ